MWRSWVVVRRNYLGFASSAGAMVASMVLAGCQPKSVPSADAGKTQAAVHGPATLPATQATAARLKPPTLSDVTPCNYPGVHNVVAYAKEVYSGSAPEGDTGFDTLRLLGIQTVISVDGAEPDVALATARGMRYVHLPITYGGMSEERKLEIARAIRDLPKPVYVHCHHGKHRSAGAAAAAAVTLGTLSPEAAVGRMKISGTAPEYKGLYACASGASAVVPAVLNAVSNAFPEISKPQGTVKTMIEIDVASENIKTIQKAGWTTPLGHADLVPAAEVGRLADYLRFLTTDDKTRAKPQEYQAWMSASMAKATALEEGLIAASAVPPAELDQRWTALQASCKQCHAKYRD